MSTVELVMIILGVVQIVLSVLLALYQIQLTNYQIAESQRSSLDQKEFQERLLTVVGQIAENTKMPRAEGVPYLVEHAADVKASPRFKSATVDRIPANARVRVVYMQHKWVFVEYAESLDLGPRSG